MQEATTSFCPLLGDLHGPSYSILPPWAHLVAWILAIASLMPCAIALWRRGRWRRPQPPTAPAGIHIQYSSTHDVYSIASAGATTLISTSDKRRPLSPPRPHCPKPSPHSSHPRLMPKHMSKSMLMLISLRICFCSCQCCKPYLFLLLFLSHRPQGTTRRLGIESLLLVFLA